LVNRPSCSDGRRRKRFALILVLESDFDVMVIDHTGR
jgi:hypothetical protein